MCCLHFGDLLFQLVSSLSWFMDSLHSADSLVPCLTVFSNYLNAHRRWACLYLQEMAIIAITSVDH